MQDTRADVTVTKHEPPPEARTPPPIPQEEGAVLDVIEGEVIAIDQPEYITDHATLKQRPYWLLIPLTVVLCLVVGAASFLLPLLTPTATITMLPVARTITLTAAIRVHARQVPALTLMQSIEVPATGIQHQAARRARGSITWYNGQFASLTIPAGTMLIGTNGVRVITDQAAMLPPVSVRQEHSGVYRRQRCQGHSHRHQDRYCQRSIDTANNAYQEPSGGIAGATEPR